MAESQVPYQYATCGTALVDTLSEARFKPYLLSAARDQDFAFALYLYNARMAKAFLYPLHILEVVLRNRISDIFTVMFNENWCIDKHFRQILTQESRDALDRGIDRSNSNNTGDIVSTLTFDFWSNLFRDEYDRSIWQTKMHDLLPNVSKTRKNFQRDIRDVNHFRNRIAHHEPVYKLNLSQIHADLIEIISWLSSEASHWVKHFSTVNQTLRSRPTHTILNAPAVVEKADTGFCTMGLTDPLSHMPKERFIVCQNDAGENIAIIEMQHIAGYILSLREGNDLMISLCDHTYSDVVKHTKSSKNLIQRRPEDNLHNAAAGLTGKKEYMIVSGDEGICGVIARAHRKY